MFALIDLDCIVYKAGFASEKKIWIAQLKTGNEIKFDIGVTKTVASKDIEKQGYKLDTVEWRPEYVVEPLNYALQRTKVLVNRILDQCETKAYKGFLSTSNDETLFRNKIAMTQGYKANRKDFKKPFHYDAIRDYLYKYYNTEIVKGIEADDALGIAQTDETIICSQDKDLLQIPGKHYNFVKDQFHYISENKGWKNFYTQVLMGDRADNIPGLFGIGAQRAKMILEKSENIKEMHEKCLKAYRIYAKREDYSDLMLEICQLCYILREDNVFFEVPK